MILEQLYNDYKSLPYTLFQYDLIRKNKKYLFEILFNINKKILTKYEHTYILNQRYNLYTNGLQKINFNRLKLNELPTQNIEITNENEYDFLINDAIHRQKFIHSLYSDYFINILSILKSYEFEITPIDYATTRNI